MTEEELFQIQKDKIRKRFLKYTRRAFKMLPQLHKPCILDVGCGSGIPTMELARLSQGKVLGIDIDQHALDKFTKSIKEMGLTDFVQVVNCSMVDMHFLDESYDIIWSEGSIYVIGFKNGLREWKRFLKPGGFMVVHDEQGDVDEKLQQISDCGYELIGYFLLSKKVWWTEYFAPLEKLIGETHGKYIHNPKILEELHHAQWELDMFKKYPEHNSSAYFVMKRN
jgi:ubiquinone/menaquinone biosynthesis C-methylase UbiE